MYYNYPVCFLREQNGSYNVCIPDFPGAFTCGDSFDDASEMALDLLASCIYYNQKTGLENPKASDRKILDLKYAEDLWGVSAGQIEVIPMGVDINAYAREHFEKTIHKNVTIESWINDQATALGINFSKTLSNALLAEIAKQKAGR